MFLQRQRGRGKAVEVRPILAIATAVIVSGRADRTFGGRWHVGGAVMVESFGVIIHIQRIISVAMATLQQQISGGIFRDFRSEEHTSELQSLMRISYAVFCLKKKI